MKRKGLTRQVQPVNQRLTVSTEPGTIYGCTGLFDLCGSADLMSLSFEGQTPFLDWIGWEGTDVCKIHEYFVHTVRPEYSGGNPTVGYLADPCADPNGVEWGFCDFQINDFARLRREGPVRDITKAGLRLCESQPRYRLDGTRIDNDIEYDMRVITETVIQDLKRMLVDGNSTTDGQFSGLETLIKTGYTDTQGRSCQAMDSIVIDWNGNNFDGGSGTTWNGSAIASGFNFVDVLIAVVEQIRQRIRMAPQLAAQNLMVGDIVLVGPTQFLRCVLDAYTCWSVCPGVQYSEANLNTFEARAFKQEHMRSLMAGSSSFITIDGLDIPLVPYDWGLIKGPTTFDAYLLTRGVGSNRLLRGQYNNMERVVAEQGGRGDLSFSATDGGRLLVWDEGDHTCQKIIEEMQPRLVVSGPWAQARFQNVVCRRAGPVISADPTESSYYPQTSFWNAGT